MPDPTRGWDPRLRAGVATALVAITLATAITYSRKLGDEASAFLRWRPQILAMFEGADVYVGGGAAYPNPPLMAMLLYPLAALPAEAGAWLLFALKVVLAVLAVGFALEAAAPRGPPLGAGWAIAAIALSLRPIMSDLQHGNVNILILFPLMAGLRALQRGRDTTAGVWLALATALKVTPALLLPYLAWKRWWRACAAFAVALLAFTLLPAVVLGLDRLADLLAGFYASMLAPYSMEGAILHTEESNQSMGAVLHRYLTDQPSIELRSGHVGFNLVSLDLDTVEWVVRGCSFALVAAVGFAARAPGSSRDLRIASEYALVLIAMLAISPRSWKHHYVVMALPYACTLAWAARPDWRAWRRPLIAAIAASQLLVLSTSRDTAKLVWFADEAHKWAQGFGAFLLSALVMGGALWAVLLRSSSATGGGSTSPPPGSAVGSKG